MVSAGAAAINNVSRLCDDFGCCSAEHTLSDNRLSSSLGSGLGNSLAGWLSSGSSLAGLSLLGGLLGGLLLLGLLLLSILLAEQGAEDARPLARLGAGLGGVLLLLLGGDHLISALLRNSGLILLLLLLGLLGDNSNGSWLGQLLKLSLVTLAGGDGLLLGLGLGRLGLDGDNPAVALGGAGGLEGVLLASNLELELAGALLGHIRDIGLDGLAKVHTSRHEKPLATYQVDDVARVSLVLGALGDEQQTLAGLTGPGGDGVGNSRLLVLVEVDELLGLNSVIVEVEEALSEAQAPENNEKDLVSSDLPRWPKLTSRRIFNLLDQTRGLVAEGALRGGLHFLLGSLSGLNNLRSSSGLLNGGSLLLLGSLNGSLSGGRSFNNGLSSRNNRGGLLNGLLNVRHD